MARVVLGSYMIRYPLGGMMSWVLQYLRGFLELGNEVWFVEKSGPPGSCFDPVTGTMGDDCRQGTLAVSRLLETVGLADRWCFVDAAGNWHGMKRGEAENAVATADVFVDMGNHGAWSAEAQTAFRRVLIDGEPGFTQLRFLGALKAGVPVPRYDAYYTTGRSLCSASSDLGRNCRSMGIRWRPIFHPVATSLFDVTPPPAEAPYTTIMNWQSYQPLRHEGKVYGHKDLEFPAFEDLPSRVQTPLELAISGVGSNREQLESKGWRLRSGHEATRDFPAFKDYITASRGEFGVCKNGFVTTESGWFSDRSAAYLASGRPVVLQETGFSSHLPTGLGLFAVGDVSEAAMAIRKIEAHRTLHEQGAREIAEQHLEARDVLRSFLEEVLA